MSGDFFSGVEQVDARVCDVEVKIPWFWRDSSGFMGVFPANLLRLKRFLPDKRLVPAQVLPGVGAIQLAVFEHKEDPVPPYNEIMMAIALNSPFFQPIPGYNLLRQMLQMYYYPYVFHMPVTTEEAMRAGVDYYNYPKFVVPIDITHSDEWVTCETKEEGDLILRLKGRKIPARRSGIMKFLFHLYHNRHPQVAESEVNAQQYALSFNPSNVELALGSSHPIATELSQLLLSTRALIYMYVPSFQAIVHGPEHISLPLLKFCLEKGIDISLESLKEKELLTKSSR